MPGSGGDVVYVEVSKGKFAARVVQVGARFEKKVRLVSGLRAGERVVTQGVMGLRGESLRSELRHQE